MNHQINITFETVVERELELCALIQKCALQVLRCENVPFNAHIDVTIVDGAYIQQLNHRYRDKDAVTDVLSFPMYEFYNGCARERLEQDPQDGRVMLGDVILCYARAVEQAATWGHSPARECGYLATHSVLHLLGYDHEREESDAQLMRSKEEESLSVLGLTRGEWYETTSSDTD